MSPFLLPLWWWWWWWFSLFCCRCYYYSVLRREIINFLLPDTSQKWACDCWCSTSSRQFSRGKTVSFISFPLLFLFKKEESPRGERTPTLAVLRQASNRYHSLQLPGQLWPLRANLARVRSSMPFYTSLFLETVCWFFDTWKDENRTYCEKQMLFLYIEAKNNWKAKKPLLANLPYLLEFVCICSCNLTLQVFFLIL